MISIALITLFYLLIFMYIWGVRRVRAFKSYLKLFLIFLGSSVALFISYIFTMLNTFNCNLYFGKDVQNMLNALIFKIKTAELIESSLSLTPSYLNITLSLIATAIAVILLIKASLLSVDNHNKNNWIIFLITPIWICSSVTWLNSAQILLLQKKLLKTEELQLITSITHCQSQKIDNSIIINNLNEATKLTQGPDYEYKTALNKAVDFFINENQKTLKEELKR